jgi:hypothetical protein
MIKIKVGRKYYKGIYNWEDITLQKFCDLAAIPMPAGYEDYIQADGKFTSDTFDQYIDVVSKITDEQINEDFPLYYRKVVECLTNIPINKINQLTNDQIEHIYNCYLRSFVLTLIYHAPVMLYMAQIKHYEPDYIRSFKIGSQRYYLPEVVNIMGQDVPLAREPIITYSEASDIFRGMKVSKEDVKRLALFMSIYCRKKGEKYNEQTALEREPIMMQVPMSIVWSVFFYTIQLLPNYTHSIQLFGRLQRSIREARDQVRDYKSMVPVV